MRGERGVVTLFILVIVFAVALYLFFSKSKGTVVLIPTPSPTPYQFPYKIPTIPKNGSYRMFIVGDSIVASLDSNKLRLDLIKYYPDSDFVTYNYGYPSTNVLDLYSRLTQNTKNVNGTENPAILTQQYELIVIESFGYNPLSQYPLAEGLQKQNEELDKSVRAILSKTPKAVLAFMTPIAPDPLTFAKSTRTLSPEERKKWVAERVAYIDNHRKFAEDHGIPVIDVYKASLKSDGSVDRSYISDDFIHPSQKGIDLTDQTITDFIFKNKIFPQ